VFGGLEFVYMRHLMDTIGGAPKAGGGAASLRAPPRNRDLKKNTDFIDAMI